MAKRATILKEIKRTIRLKFLTDTGKIHTISLNCASAKLAGAEGAALVKRVMEGILAHDIFTVKLVKAVGAELVERRVILTAEDFQSGEAQTEIEGAPMALTGRTARFGSPSQGIGGAPEMNSADVSKSGYYALNSRYSCLHAEHSFHTAGAIRPCANAPPPACAAAAGEGYLNEKEIRAVSTFRGV